MNKASLQDSFVKGRAQTNMDGFYNGKLLVLLPCTFLEHFAGFFVNFYLPWKGKYFYQKNHKGENILPKSAKKLLLLLPTKIIVDNSNSGGFHAFPFKTSLTKGVDDPVNVLHLDYDIPQNPPLIKRVVDEVVETEGGVFLGKAYLKEKNRQRLLAYFTLQKGTL